MISIAPAKAHALPSTLDARRAKIRKASLTTQKKSRDSSCSLSFSFCVSIALMLWSVARKLEQRISVPVKKLRSRTSGGLPATGP
jgi:hypothetical protein